MESYDAERWFRVSKALGSHGKFPETRARVACSGSISFGFEFRGSRSSSYSAEP